MWNRTPTVTFDNAHRCPLKTQVLWHYCKIRTTWRLLFFCFLFGQVITLCSHWQIKLYIIHYTPPSRHSWMLFTQEYLHESQWKCIQQHQNLFRRYGELGCCRDCKTLKNVSNVVERSTKGRKSQANTGKHETYERLAEESTESLECEIVAIKRSAGADPRYRKD